MLMPRIVAAVEAYATVGEISDAMRRVFGEYQEAVVVEWICDNHSFRSLHASIPLAAIWLPTILLGGALAQTTAPSCKNCAEWNKPNAPFRIFGDTYYVGPHGLSSVLITSAAGHILIDGDLPESAQLIVANIRSLGFRIEDVKLIVNSHVHFDHAGGIAELQRRSGARVVASKWSAAVLKQGGPGTGDPQYGSYSRILPSTTFTSCGTAKAFGWAKR